MTRTARLSRISAVDRCDRCGAQAYVHVDLLSGGELFFCGHHARQYEHKLREVAIAIQDELDRLTEIPATHRRLVHPSQRGRLTA